MAGKVALASLLVVSCVFTSIVVTMDEPFCTSRFDFEEKLLHKVIRLEHAMELLQDEVTKDLTEFGNRQAKASCRCPDIWIRYKGSCYLFLPDDVTFVEAEYKCTQHASHLVKIDDADENAFVKTHSSHLKDNNRWIGLTDESTDGVWEWRDGSNPDFLGWLRAEPNGKEGENCSILYPPYQYDWIDVTCMERYSPLCEKRTNFLPSRIKYRRWMKRQRQNGVQWTASQRYISLNL